MATATNAQKIAGLYAAFFERAPDAAGLAYWQGQFTGTATVNTIAQQFAANPVFASTYGSMTDIQFVNAVYQNVLGAAGDAAGVDYWVGQLKNGGADARANFVAQFVNDALTVDVSTFTNLTAAERAVAQSRQDTLTNKANVGLYFAEKFGAASNITTTGDVTADPAYQAAQAAVKNVTADAASVSAAQGRIDIAVTTSNPVGSLVGQNSALTAALVDLQTKNAAEDAALLALGNAANDANATPLTGAALQKFLDDVADGTTTPISLINQATTDLAAAKSAAATADKNLVDARALTTDAQLNTNVSNAQAAVTADATAKAAQNLANSTKAAVAATTDVAVLTGLQDALTAYIKAGGLTTTSLGGSETVASLVNTVNGVLTVKVGDVVGGVTQTADTIAAAQKAAVEAFLTDGSGAVGSNAIPTYVLTPAGSTATASETALINAIAAVEKRDTAYAAADKAEADFKLIALGQNLRDAEGEVTTRDDLIKASTDAAAAVTKETADLTKVQAAFDAHSTADANATAASKAITDLGYNVDSLTSGKDLFVADTKVATTTIGAGFATGDELFIGTQYKFGGVTDATKTIADLYAAGSATALEVFFEQSGADTIVHVEAKAFANASAGAATGADIANITLTGVTASTLTFENGFVHVA